MSQAQNKKYESDYAYLNVVINNDRYQRGAIQLGLSFLDYMHKIFKFIKTSEYRYDVFSIK